MENIINLLYIVGGLCVYTAFTLPVAMLVGKCIHYGTNVEDKE